MAKGDYVDFVTCHKNRQDCFGKKWWKAVLVLVIVVGGALWVVGEKAVRTSADVGAHIQQQRRMEDRNEERWRRLEDKIDQLLRNGHAKTD